MTVVVSTFYKFVAIDDTEALRATLAAFCSARGVKGTILIADEGLNATVSGAAAAIDALHSALRSDPRFSDLATKESSAPTHPFGRLKVKVKPEIVTFGAPNANPAVRVGRYVRPEDWNALISDPDVIVVDARNDYEVEIGTFTGARNPKTRTFSEFPQYVARELAGDKRRTVAMFCTGGIRCEKATSYLLGLGFEDVRHLEGGILKYLEAAPVDESLWRGECFVFDDRVALEHGVVIGAHQRCDGCGRPVALAADAPSRCAECARTTATPDTPASRRSA